MVIPPASVPSACIRSAGERLPRIRGHSYRYGFQLIGAYAVMLKRTIGREGPNKLSDYYQDLAILEGKPLNNPLIASWRTKEIQAVTADFRTASEACRLPGFAVRVGDMCPQAIGNAVASLTAVALKYQLKWFTIEECPGAGYPDFKLVHLTSGRAYPLEIKATGKRQGTNSRVVLTSSSTKLRELFAPPIRHLIATVHYLRTPRTIRIDSLRLNFLRPQSLVNVRFEGAVTSKLLHQDDRVVWIRGANV